ncbi:MAG TPA: bifunctional phosphoribosylaminoimidazolecarboxamide formyltransferase/IMP cyclohydrolase [Terriglobales bacterium]
MPSRASIPPAPRRALLSVSDKTGLEDFARRLQALGFELVSTGGTARALRQAGLEVRDVAEVTGFPEMLEGRVKTLHPSIHGGLLGRWLEASHRQPMEQHGISPIDVLVVNLYPFEAVAARAATTAGVEAGELIENIDIGGPAMLRSGAKNFESVAVLTDPADYATVAGELEGSGSVSAATRWRLAQKVFVRTAAYDTAIATTLAELGAEVPAGRVRVEAEAFPARLHLDAVRERVLRYGENPHQRAAVYANPAMSNGRSLARAQPLQGKELSFNNLVDLEAAAQLAGEFDPAATAAVAIIKHTNPAGCGLGGSVREAYARALACDPLSAFGSVIGINRELDGDAAEAMAGLFVECIVAPSFSPAALERLHKKKNLRLVAYDAYDATQATPSPRLTTISGGWLLQDADSSLYAAGDEGWRVVTQRRPTAAEEDGLRFGWAVVKHVKSNAVLFARPGQILAVGAGQMSRVDAVRVAVLKAQLPLQASVLASDAFFPFPDGIEAAAAEGATAIVQPGGSVQDSACITACDRLGLAMVFTGTRHFKH